MSSVSLDPHALPERAVGYVICHELLHKKHGVKLTNWSRMAHTSAFRKGDQSSRSRLGSHVRKAIHENLQSRGIGHLPAIVPEYLRRPVRINVHGSPFANLIDELRD